MAFFLAGCALLVLLLLGARAFSGADPRRLASAARKAGGAAALGAAGFLILRGALPIAIPLAVFGLSLLRGGGSGVGTFGGSPTPGQASNVRTDKLEMTLDHDSGQMDGTCLIGRFSGRALSSLSDADVMELLHTFRSDGAQEAALVEAYLDWRLPGWRDRDEDRTERAGHGRGRGRGRQSGMSPEEAYAVLGIGPEASDEDIRQAHRRLMMKMHPDQGGSTYLAARINEAKEVLLGRG